MGDFARSRAAVISKLMPHAVDAKLSACERSGGACVGGCVKPNFVGDLCTVLEEQNLTARGGRGGKHAVSPDDHVLHRYLLVVDGSGYSNRLYWMAFSNSLLIVQQSSILSWLRPGSVPIFQP